MVFLRQTDIGQTLAEQTTPGTRAPTEQKRHRNSAAGHARNKRTHDGGSSDRLTVTSHRFRPRRPLDGTTVVVVTGRPIARTTRRRYAPALPTSPSAAPAPLAAPRATLRSATPAGPAPAPPASPPQPPATHPAAVGESFSSAPGSAARPRLPWPPPHHRGHQGLPLPLLR